MELGGLQSVFKERWASAVEDLEEGQDLVAKRVLHKLEQRVRHLTPLLVSRNSVHILHGLTLLYVGLW